MQPIWNVVDDTETIPFDFTPPKGAHLPEGLKRLGFVGHTPRHTISRRTVAFQVFLLMAVIYVIGMCLLTGFIGLSNIQ